MSKNLFISLHSLTQGNKIPEHKVKQNHCYKNGHESKQIIRRHHGQHQRQHH